jgi:signal transduction histidine kinase
MTVRLKLALTIFATGLVTALLVIATVAFAFQRFEHETTYRRGSAFLGRVVTNYDHLFEMHERRPGEFQQWLRNMVLFEPDTQLYLLDVRGTVLASSGKPLPAGFKVDLRPVLQAVGGADAAFVMGDDPERMDANAVIAVEPVRQSRLRTDPVMGYLYLVLHSGQLPEGRWAAMRASLARPALGLIAMVVAFTTLVAVLIIVSVTRPLQRLTDAVGIISQRGLGAAGADIPDLLPERTHDEFGQLTSAFAMMLDICQRQWNELRRLDHFRREGVSNLSHDLRSPLTATVACLETLEGRWAPSAEPHRVEDRRLVEIALRNTRNAARLVRSMGDLATLDEPEFKLHPERVDTAELLDDICMRFADRAAQQGVTLWAEPGRASDSGQAQAPGSAVAAVDIELFERAVANLVDNALKFCPPGSRIALCASRHEREVEIRVQDNGPGIAAQDLPHLFDRFYQSRHNVEPATGEAGKGLGLAIVKRIVELHNGALQVTSQVGLGTQVVLRLPAAAL